MLVDREKRFEVNLGIAQFVDNRTGKTYSEYNLDEIVDLLNKLNTNNERLKKELDCFKPVLFNDRNGKTIILYGKGDMYEEV